MKHFLIIFLLCFTTGIDAKEIICEVERPSVVERIVNRSYPSIVATWSHEIENEPLPENVWEWTYYKEVLSRRDLFWQGSFLAAVGFPAHTSKLVIRGGADLEHRDLIVGRRHQIQALNPDFLFLVEMYYYGIHMGDSYPEEDWPYWLRDKEGNIAYDPDYNQHLIDYTLLGAEDHFVEQAVSVAKCGIFDGIFLDLWAEEEAKIPGTSNTAHLYHGNRVEALVSLVKRIREAVGDEFLIIVNARTLKIPRSAPYVNGVFIETWDAAYPRKRLIEFENALSWYEENLRYPQVNFLSIAKSRNEPWNSPANQRLMRATTTLTLTHSDGYSNFKGKNNSVQFWYRFFDAPLGRPVGAKGQLYENIDGLFIREFTNGYAVYNRSGKAQEIELPQEGSGWHSGVADKRWHTLGDLDGEIYLKSVATRADINGDGVVNILDLVRVANGFNSTEPDINGDGVVNVLDLVLVSSNIGTGK